MHIIHTSPKSRRLAHELLRERQRIARLALLRVFFLIKSCNDVLEVDVLPATGLTSSPELRVVKDYAKTAQRTRFRQRPQPFSVITAVATATSRSFGSVTDGHACATANACSRSMGQLPQITCTVNSTRSK